MPKNQKAVPPVEDYSLVFYIKYDTRPRRILVPPTDCVDGLIKKIQAIEKPSEPAYFWKVEKDLKPTRRDLAEFRLDDELDVKLVDSSKLISDLWEEQPPAGRIHIFVDVPERPPPGTNQGTSLRLMRCLVVSNSGEPIRQPISRKENEDDIVLDIAVSMKNLKLFPDEVSPVDISVWKLLSFNDSPQDTRSERVKDLLDTPDDHGAVIMAMDKPLRFFFPPGQPLLPECIHVIAQLPPGEKDLDKSVLEPKDRPLPFENAITFTIPSKQRFPSLRQFDISDDEVETARGAAEPFIKDFLSELARKRVVPSGSSFSTALSELLPMFGASFDEYFTNPQQKGPTPDECSVTLSEFAQYCHVLGSKYALDVEQFHVGKEEQIAVHLLRDLAGEFKNRGIRHNATFRKPWGFPLIASAQTDGEKFEYTPMSDFSLQIEEFPHCILEVTSSESQADLWRMILQASCLARLGNELRSGNTTDPVVIMAVYIDSQLRAHEYLVYQPDPENKQVELRKSFLSLTEPRSAFKFIFRLYNFLSRAASDNRKFKKTMSQELQTMANAVIEQKMRPLTDQKGKPGGGGTVTTQQGQDSGLLGDSTVQDSLKAAGYELTPADPMLVPLSGLKLTMRDATSSDGSRVVLKVVASDTQELAILKHLNEIKQATNHTIELHGVVDITVAKVIALPWRIPLDTYFNPYNPPKSVASFPGQLLEGVAFLHEHKVAHLDLKPGNVVIERPQRLIIIDFDVSVFVEDEHTTTKGFCGTPPWVAPEVGTRDGPEMTYSPILADRWACGRMVVYLEALEDRRGDSRQYRVIQKLMSENPRSRPSLKDALDVYGRPRVKRMVEAETSGGQMQKKPRMMHSIDSTES